MKEPFADLDRFRITPTPPKGSKAPPDSPGAWLPWPLVEKVVRLRLRPASRWQVFVLLLCVSSRYGGHPAFLSVKDIAARTGLSERTVKASLADLLRSNLIRRPRRYRCITVPMVSKARPKGPQQFLEAPLPTPSV